MKRTALVRHTPLRRVSLRRLEQLRSYAARRAQFLRDHPYCQLWLAEHGVDEARTIRERGVLPFGGQPRVQVPRSATVHHRNKRRGGRLLDEREWLAVSWTGHRRIEDHKAWARDRGFLKSF